MKRWGSALGLLVAILLIAGVAFASSGQAAPAERPLLAKVGTAFTYQGYLEDGGMPADGTYYLRFYLYNLPTGGAQIGPTVLHSTVSVEHGYFTVELDFGVSPYAGDARWLEIDVWDKVGLPNFTKLSPRQELTPIPYAIYAGYAESIPFAGDGVAETASRSDHTHFGQTWSSLGDIGFRVVNDSGTTGAVALSGVASDASGSNTGVYGQTDSPSGFGGNFLNAGGGVAGYFGNDGSDPTVHVRNEGSSGAVLHLQNAGSGLSGSGGGNFIQAVNSDNSDVQFRVATDGAVYSDMGYKCGQNISDTVLNMTPPSALVFGQNDSSLDPCLEDEAPADFAEMLPGEGVISVGDVLVVTTEGHLAVSGDPYQTTVVGVHSYRPSYLGNAQFAEEVGYVPLAMMGVVPVKASAENGAIAPGDLLVASATPGHAMRAGENPPQGTVIGKALSPLEEGTGYIQMIVTLQ